MDIRPVDSPSDSSVDTVAFGPAAGAVVAPQDFAPTAISPEEQPGIAPGKPTESEYELIGGFPVHPLASKFPLVTGQEFEEMVEAIARARTIPAVELSDGLLIDGRNRVRAVEEVRRRGIEMELPTVEWHPSGDETVAEHIFAVNICRRHLTVDQRAALSTVFVPAIRESRQRRQAATRFGGPATTVTQDSAPPLGEPGEAVFDDKEATSTRGQLAKLAGISRFKAEQAIALADGVSDGVLTETDFTAVTTGEKRLSDVLKKKAGGRKKAGSTRRGDCHPDELVYDPALTEDAVLRHFDKWMQSYPIVEHRIVRRWVAAKIARDQREFDR